MVEVKKMPAPDSLEYKVNASLDGFGRTIGDIENNLSDASPEIRNQAQAWLKKLGDIRGKIDSLIAREKRQGENRLA